MKKGIQVSKKAKPALALSISFFTDRCLGSGSKL
jgi:hypothetical protein